MLVVGGGVAGMAFAIRASQLGQSVEIVELDPQWRVAGAGISVTGPTYRALKRLGVLDAVKAGGFLISHGAVICAADGSPIAEVPYRAIEPDLPTAGGILRPKLHEILSAKVRALGVRVTLGATLQSTAESHDGVTALLSNGETREVDLVVAADGAFSAVRAQLFPDADAPAYTGQYCWRLLAQRPAQVDRPHFFMSADVTCGLMPVSADEMYLWLLETAPARRRINEADLTDHLRDLLAPFGGVVDAVRAAIDAGAPIIARPLDALLLPLPWHRGKTILIGDAVHATTPHLASGAGIAVEDGLLLAEALAGGDPIEAVFDQFEARRWERCRLVVEDSVAIGRMQQTDASPAALNERMSRAQAALALDI